MPVGIVLPQAHPPLPSFFRPPLRRSPAAGGVVYVDSASLNFAVKSATGVINHGVQTRPPIATQFLTSINDAGQVGIGQPAFSDLSGALACSQRPALTGQATAPAGSCITTVASLPTALPAAGSILYTAIPAPVTPGLGSAAVYVDSASKNLAVKNDAGVVNHGAQTKPPVANEFMTGLNDAGQFSTAQPTFGNLAGAATLPQVPAHIRAMSTLAFLSAFGGL